MKERVPRGRRLVGEVERDAWAMLVDGHASVIDGATVRFYPSASEVARRLGLTPSTVTRWARRVGVTSARAARLDMDRREGRMPIATVESLVSSMGVLLDARRATGKPGVRQRQMDGLQRITAWLAGAPTRHPPSVASIERLRDSLLPATREASS